MLSIEEVCELSGIDPQTLRNWIAAGVVQPAVVGGRGRGLGHRFTAAQAIGLIVAEELRQSDRGCAIGVVGQVVEAFGSVDAAWLDKKIRQSGKHFVTVHNGTPLLQTGDARWGWPDVQTAYDKVLKYATENK